MILDRIRSIMGHTRPAPRRARLPAGKRYYLIGDIHGRLDLFEALIDAIEREERKHSKAQTRVVLLGDLIDRGPDSAGVVRRAREWQTRRDVRILKGNHEDMLLGSLGDPQTLRQFLRHGGRQTLISYGISPQALQQSTLEELVEELPRHIPQSDLDFIAGFELSIEAGDYLFVHAGINPALAIDKQKPHDLMWIRDSFVTHKGPLPKVIVHGHTIFDQVADCGNRIGIDTGAWCNGTLTALVLEDDRRETLQAIQPDREDGRIGIIKERLN